MITPFCELDDYLIEYIVVRSCSYALHSILYERLSPRLKRVVRELEKGKDYNLIVDLSMVDLVDEIPIERMELSLIRALRDGRFAICDALIERVELNVNRILHYSVGFGPSRVNWVLDNLGELKGRIDYNIGLREAKKLRSEELAALFLRLGASEEVYAREKIERKSIMRALNELLREVS